MEQPEASVYAEVALHLNEETWKDKVVIVDTNVLIASVLPWHKNNKPVVKCLRALRIAKARLSVPSHCVCTKFLHS